MIILKILGIVALIATEALSIYTLYTSWYGTGMKDSLGSIFMFMPVIVLAVFAGLFMGLGFGGVILKKLWLLAIPPLAVVVDAMIKFNN